MAKKKVVSIMGKIEQITTDRTRYKNYSPQVTFDNLRVVFEVPEDEAVVKDDGEVIITLEGFAVHILDVFAQHIDDMHRDWERRKAEEDEQRQLEQMRKSSKK